MTHEEHRAAMKKFLVGLEKLTRETGIAIGGTGDGGSPYLQDLIPHCLEPDYGYVSSVHGNDVEWLRLDACDRKVINSKTEQESEGNNDDI